MVYEGRRIASVPKCPEARVSCDALGVGRGHPACVCAEVRVAGRRTRTLSDRPRLFGRTPLEIFNYGHSITCHTTTPKSFVTQRPDCVRAPIAEQSRVGGPVFARDLDHSNPFL
ncbi:hypothetical protein EVAR_27504_1 [Eumeta japonica]|uniref:Uncharacterized protein n=1 Tax=Eumeta variegata TaxID=151549 RepID=A0A4C1XHD2_EUMVA|nr:hypothetical protein EVAR_27504_1 [Eumeta japonica]